MMANKNAVKGDGGYKLNPSDDLGGNRGVIWKVFFCYL
jgi:hypothetical protein